MMTDQTLLFVDESSFCSLASSTKVYSRIGQPALIRQATSVTDRIYAISGVTPRGELLHQVYTQTIRSRQVIQFLERVLHHFSEHVNVIWDNASIHTSRELKAFLASNAQARQRLHLYLTPVYCPQYNPDEQVWNYLKSEYLKHRWSRTKTELRRTVQQGLQQLAKTPQRIRSAFRHPDVKLMEV